MPGFTTHYLFGTDLYHKLTSGRIRQNLKQNHAAFALGLQGPDLFFYYLPLYLLPQENLGALAHHKNTGTFFSNLLQSRNLFAGNKCALDIADAYITGFIGHYTLDCTIHPYIYAFTGYPADNPPSNTEYFGQHAYLEIEIDKELLFLKKHLAPSRFRQSITIHLNRRQHNVIVKMLAYAYKNTYPDILTGKLLIGGAPLGMRLGVHSLRDPSGQKKVLARALERLFPGKAYLSPLIASDKYHFIADPFNHRHRQWTHPWNKKTSDASFDELYENALNHYYRRVQNFYRLKREGFSGSGLNKFLEEYGNLSFLSGLSCQ